MLILLGIRILFHRGVYPAEDFYVEKRFGLDLTLILVSSIEDYIELTLHRLRGIYPTFTPVRPESGL